jgi:hypothetical protein
MLSRAAQLREGRKIAEIFSILVKSCVEVLSGLPGGGSII